MEELGFKGFDAMQWYGIGRPGRHAGRRRAAASTRRQVAVLKAPDLREKLSGEAVEPMPMTPGAVRRSTSAPTSRAGPRSPRRATSSSTTDSAIRSAHQEIAMARNTQVAADPDAPPDHRASWREFVAGASVARLERRGRARGASHAS